MTASLPIPTELLDALANLVADRLADRERPEPKWPEWMSVETAARYLDCSPERIEKLKRRGDLPHVQDGRGARVFFRRAALDAWMGQREHHVARPPRGRMSGPT